MKEGGNQARPCLVSCPVLSGDFVLWGFLFVCFFYKNKDRRTHLEKVLGNPGCCL